MRPNNLLNNGPLSATANRLFCQLLIACRRADSDADVRMVAPIMLQEGDVYLPIPRQDGFPRALIIQDAENVLVLMGGVEDAAHVSTLIRGWANPSPFFTSWGASSGVGAGTNDFIVACPSGTFTRQRNYFFVGHSMGGAILTSLAAWMGQRQFPGTVKVWSYGSPRPGDPRMQQWLNRVGLTRWFNHNDVVRVVPPRPYEAPVLGIISDSLFSRTTRALVQPLGGYVLQSSGSYGPAETWPLDAVIADAALVSWMLSNQCLFSDGHDISEYRRRFAALEIKENQRPNLVIEPNPPETPFNPSRVQARQLATLGDGMAAEAGRQPQQIAVTRGSRDYYYPRKHGRTWVVVYQGNVVGIGPGKRQAYHLARTSNRARTGR